LRDDRAPLRAHLDQAFAEQESQRFADRRARHPEARRQLDLVQPRARQQLAGGDLFFDGFAQAFREAASVHEVISRLSERMNLHPMKKHSAFLLLRFVG